MRRNNPIMTVTLCFSLRKELNYKIAKTFTQSQKKKGLIRNARQQLSFKDSFIKSNQVQEKSTTVPLNGYLPPSWFALPLDCAECGTRILKMSSLQK